VLEIQQSKTEEKSKGHSVIAHDNKGRSFIGVNAEHPKSQGCVLDEALWI
jgi:hypothetical protein